MIKGSKLITCGVLLTTVATTLAAVHYVDVNSANPAPPYTNWATAATNIQDAVDAAVAGDQIAVTNGIYATGARTVDGYTTNRVAVNKPLSLRSINGPQFTTISGSGSVRCVYLTNGASLSGFTLTNGFARFDGGGLFSESANAVVSNCVLSGNSVYSSDGGGAFGCMLNNCTLTGNSADGVGGGAYGCMLNNCILTGNSASDGGGAYWCTLNNCTLTGNSAEVVGGGAAGCTLSNCTLAGNSRYYGVIDCTLNNCIVYFNDGGNYYGCTLNYCCTTPLPTNGVGNISLDPQLASASHLSFSSPCRGAGNAAYVTGTDIDGEDWADPPSMGSDEFHASAVGGPLSAVIAASFTSVLTGFTVQLTALIEGRTTASSWDFGDGTKLTNQPYASHAWAALGDYPVVLHAFNESQPGGITATATVHVVAQPVHYVALGSANPVAPFSTWATAATNIQDAVNAATVAGALVLVTNGIYTTGGRTVYGTLINRVAVNKPLTLRSVNGPQYTIIQGYQVPGTTNGDGAIRCVYLTNGASLSGFTLSNGATRTSYDPAYRESSGGGLWCESTSGVLVSNCVVISNSASSYGGGAFLGTLINCTLAGNSAYDLGGGAYDCTLSNCALRGNSAAEGGGAGAGTLSNCTLTGNSATFGGGACFTTLNNCTLTGNWAFQEGGGAEDGTLNSCALTGNSAYDFGGGADGCTLNNCTLAGNSAFQGGGSYGGRLNNCIIYFNTASQGSNYIGSILNYCCASPLPTDAGGNIAVDPHLASASHLSAVSPCRGAGSAALANGTDIDGEPWLDPPSIGCDEYHLGAATGPLSVAITASFTNVVSGLMVPFAASVEGRTTLSVWDFGDSTAVTNQPFTSHAWVALGDYPVVLRAFSESQPGGISATVTVHVVQQPVHYVAAASINPVPPYTSWTTAATDIQNAVDAASVAGALVLVTNGIYSSGGRAVYGTMTNRVAVDKPLTLRSVNGPGCTVIQGLQVSGGNGDSAVRCVYLTNAASLSGFTLTKGATRAVYNYPAERDSSGGGLWCEPTSAGMVSNCVVVGNSAYGLGGGAYQATLTNCTLTGNSAYNEGGGAALCMLYNCMLSNNSAYFGGGAFSCTLKDCRLTSNSANAGPTASGGGAYECMLNNCMLTGNSASGGGGGALECTLDHCTLTGNSANTNSSSGGGVAGGSLNNCIITGNRARYGGGASPSLLGDDTVPVTLNSCVLTGNSADWGGGAFGCTLNNCIVYFNTGLEGANYDPSGFSTLNYCCTTPPLTNGFGNITNAPLFVDQASGNLRLQSNSPCINAGNNSYVTNATDLDGNPRIAGGTVDMGAYEFQAPTSTISYAWLQQYGLPTDGSADTADPDGDGVNNFHEWLAGTNPTNPFSSPAQLTIIPSGTNVIITWPTNAGGFTVQSTTNLSSPSVWVTNSPAPVLIGGQNTVTNPITGPQQFYRLSQ